MKGWAKTLTRPISGTEACTRRSEHGRRIKRDDDDGQIPHYSSGEDYAGIPLPHRSFAQAEYVDPHVLDVNGLKYLSGTIGLIFGEGPMNIGHQAKYLFQLKKAVRAINGALTQVSWAWCRDARMVENCEAAEANFDQNLGAKQYFRGLVSILFGNDTKVVGDYAVETEVATLGDGAEASAEDSLVCFERAVVPGESDTRFIGAREARNFRDAAYRALELPRVRVSPPPTVLVIQRAIKPNRENRRIIDLEDTEVPRDQP